MDACTLPLPAPPSHTTPTQQARWSLQAPITLLAPTHCVCSKIQKNAEVRDSQRIAVPRQRSATSAQRHISAVPHQRGTTSAALLGGLAAVLLGAPHGAPGALEVAPLAAARLVLHVIVPDLVGPARLLLEHVPVLALLLLRVVAVAAVLALNTDTQSYRVYRALQSFQRCLAHWRACAAQNPTPTARKQEQHPQTYYGFGRSAHCYCTFLGI